MKGVIYVSSLMKNSPHEVYACSGDLLVPFINEPHLLFYCRCIFCLQGFDIVGFASGRTPGL